MSQTPIQVKRLPVDSPLLFSFCRHVYTLSPKPPNHDDDSCSLRVNTPYYRIQSLRLTAYYYQEGGVGGCGICKITGGTIGIGLSLIQGEDWRIWWQEVANCVTFMFSYSAFAIRLVLLQEFRISFHDQSLYVGFPAPLFCWKA